MAAKLAGAGFTLKKSHFYKDGFQAGLVLQAVKLKNGQYFEVISLNTKNEKRGELAKWYESQIKAGTIGATLVLTDLPLSLEQVHQRFEQAHIKSQLHKFDLYSWLSFKTRSAYAPLSFIEGAFTPADSEEIITHGNGAYAIGRLQLRPYGSAEMWAKILTLSQAHEAALDFSSSLFAGTGFITEVEIKTKKRPLPAPLKLDHVILKFVK